MPFSCRWFPLFLALTAAAATAAAYPGAVIDSLEAPHPCPTGLAFDGHYLWAADHKADRIVCLDPEDGSVLREIPSPGHWPMGLAWDGTHLWNADLRQKKIFRIDPQDGSILETMYSPFDHPQGLTWDGSALWISDPREDKIARMDMWDGTAVKIFMAPSKNVHGLTYDGAYLWCTDRIDDEIHMVDPESGRVILILDAPGPYPRGLAWDGAHLWNADYQNDRLYRLVRSDEDLFRLKDVRQAAVTLTHEFKIGGQGHLLEADAYLAVPENMPQQRIDAVEFSPPRTDMVTDRWGQTCAHFHHGRTGSPGVLSTVMEIEAEISAIDYFVFPDRCGSLEDIPEQIAKRYTADGSKYQLADPYIRETVREIVGEERNPYWMARRIFDHVREHLEYELVGGWNTAPVVLKRGTGSCSEYTFSFIALCRAAGLPARYVGSIVVRGDDASLDQYFHRWPEIYLPGYGWIPMDPQGGDDPLPRDQARSIGHLSNRHLVVCQGGGDSEYLGWHYINHQTYRTDPQVEVEIDAFGEWEPLKK
jgi:sugar lactone lactonase YvrE